MSSENNKLMLKFSMAPLLGVLVALVVSGAIAIFLIQNEANKHHRAELAESKLLTISTFFDRRVASLLAQLNSVALTPEVVSITEEADPTSVSLRETALARQVPDAVRVRVFPIGTARVNREATPPFSFTSLDMVNRVERGEEVYPEAIQADGKWIVAFASPIKNRQAIVVGTVFAYLDMKTIQAELPSVEGNISLIQKYGTNPPVEILSVGDSGGIAPTLEKQLLAPNWSIKFQPGSSLALAETVSLFDILIPLISFFLISILAVIFGAYQTSKMIQADAEQLGLQMKNVAGRKYTPHMDYLVPVFNGLDGLLARISGAPTPTSEIVSAQPSAKTQEARTPPAPAPAPIVDSEPVPESTVEIEMMDEEEFESQMEETSDNQVVPDAGLAEIFRAYDIRGVVDETLTPENVVRIGQAIGSEAQDHGQTSMVVAADGRISSPDVLTSLIQGLTSSGIDIVNLGFVPTPLLYFAIQNSETTSGVMVTGSHNPPEYNGFKIVFNGKTLVADEIGEIYRRFSQGDFLSGSGEVTEFNIHDDYMDAICDDVVVAQPLKVVVDCGNGIAGEIAPELYSNLGCDIIPLYCDVDGQFPNHHPDPTISENLSDLIDLVIQEKADLGIALDGDGDRMVAVSGSGNIIWPDQLMMLFAKDVVSRNPGSDVVYDVKCTRHLNTVISSFGGRPILSRSGHSYIKEKMLETNAVLGGEFAGHFCFGERWFGFDDGLYAGARLLEIVGSTSEDLTELMEEFPTSITTPEIKISVEETSKFMIVEKFSASANFPDTNITTIDGIRIDFSDGWGLLRASNTGPNLTLRFEADTDQALNRIVGEFREQLSSIDKSLDFSI